MIESYEEFKKNYAKTHPLAVVINAENPLSDFEMHHEYYIHVLYNGIDVDMSGYKRELTKHVQKLISDDLVHENQVDYNRYHECMLMLQKAGTSKKELEEIDSTFLSRVFDFLRNDLMRDFSIFWDNNMAFLIFRESFYKDIRIGTTEHELYFQSIIFTNHRCDFNTVIVESYVMFLKWVQQCYYYYQRRPTYCDAEYQYAPFIEEITALCVTCCKENCGFTRMSNYIMFREKFITDKEKKKVKKIVRKAVGVIAGYGERPMRLLICFGILAVVFSVTYFFLPGIVGLPDNAFDRVIASLYFYITTCLTIGYGEIYPETSWAMMVVMLNEILGFVIGGSFISLYLRKIFRY